MSLVITFLIFIIVFLFVIVFLIIAMLYLIIRFKTPPPNRWLYGNEPVKIEYHQHTHIYSSLTGGSLLALILVDLGFDIASNLLADDIQEVLQTYSIHWIFSLILSITAILTLIFFRYRQQKTRTEP